MSDYQIDHTQTNQMPVMLVTGSARRIGAGIIQAAHTTGYRVIIHCHRSQNEANRLADKLNQIRAHSAAVIVQDLAVVHDDLTAFVHVVITAFGRLDVLVHNASRFYPTPIGHVNHAQWDELMLTNAKAPLLLSQALLPYLQHTQGCVISLLDIHAVSKPFVGYSVYNMAKAAHQMMVQSLALECAPHVRINGVAPGVNVLPEGEQALDNTCQQRIINSIPMQRIINSIPMQRIINSIPMQRIGTPSDIAQAVLYLAQASYVTGQIISVDGGRSLTLAGG